MVPIKNNLSLRAGGTHRQRGTGRIRGALVNQFHLPIWKHVPQAAIYTVSIFYVAHMALFILKHKAVTSHYGYLCIVWVELGVQWGIWLCELSLRYFYNCAEKKGNLEQITLTNVQRETLAGEILFVLLFSLSCKTMDCLPFYGRIIFNTLSQVRVLKSIESKIVFWV